MSPQYLSSQRLGITKGFLPLIFEAMEKAPLFEPTAAIPPKGDLAFNGAVLKRLPFFYNVNHLFYYEKVCRVCMDHHPSLHRERVLCFCR